MVEQLSRSVGADPFSCPDVLVIYSPKFDEYGIVVHDGGQSYVLIQFCPWCGDRLPESKRDEWFDELERRGIHYTSAVPPEFETDAWWRGQ